MNALAVEWSLSFSINRYVPENKTLIRMSVGSEFTFCFDSDKKCVDQKERRKRAIAKRKAKKESNRHNLAMRYVYNEELNEQD